MLRLGGMCIEVFKAAEDTSSETGGEQRVGFNISPSRCRSWSPSLTDCKKTESPDPIIDCSNVTPGFRICFFNDPEGNILELMEGWKDE